MIATEVGLGVKPANEYLFLVIASPAGAYFPGGVKPVSIWVSEDRVRAVPGGMGDAKTGGNYAASLLAQAEAAAKGCDQVCYLDAVEHTWVEELGGMNLYFVYGDKIVTPALTGSILEGVTRDSLLSVARDLGYEAVEERVSVDQWQRDTENGQGFLTEVFACGTAAVITPVGTVKRAGGKSNASGGEPGEVTRRLRRALLDIQRGTAEDKHGWMHPLG
ncbi:branched-chain amino acid aminotransferase [Streptomyces hirsutus]